MGDGRGGVQAALARETLSSMAIGTKTDVLSIQFPADNRENLHRLELSVYAQRSVPLLMPVVPYPYKLMHCGAPSGSHNLHSDIITLHIRDSNFKPHSQSQVVRCYVSLISHDMSVDTLCPTVLGCPVDTQPVVDQGSANALLRRSLQSYSRA